MCLLWQTQWHSSIVRSDKVGKVSRQECKKDQFGSWKTTAHHKWLWARAKTGPGVMVRQLRKRHTNSKSSSLEGSQRYGKNLEINYEHRSEEKILCRHDRVHTTVWVWSMDAHKCNGKGTGWLIYKNAEKSPQCSLEWKNDKRDTLWTTTKAQWQNCSQKTAISGTLSATSGTWCTPSHPLGTHARATEQRTTKNNICRTAEERHWHNNNWGVGSHDGQPQDMEESCGFSTPVEQVSK